MLQFNISPIVITGGEVWLLCSLCSQWLSQTYGLWSQECAFYILAGWWWTLFPASGVKNILTLMSNEVFSDRCPRVMWSTSDNGSMLPSLSQFFFCSKKSWDQRSAKGKLPFLLSALHCALDSSPYALKSIFYMIFLKLIYGWLGKKKIIFCWF